MGTSSGGSSAGSGSGSASGQRSVSGLYDGSGGSGCAQPADNSLGLMHLRKLYSELKSSTAGSSQRDLENMLYNMLPLFCKVSPLVLFLCSFVLSASSCISPSVTIAIHPFCSTVNQSISQSEQD